MKIDRWLTQILLMLLCALLGGLLTFCFVDVKRPQYIEETSYVFDGNKMVENAHELPITSLPDKKDKNSKEESKKSQADNYSEFPADELGEF